MTEIHKYLRVKSAHKAESALLEDFWGKQANETALLISERLINVPLELAPPLYQGLFEEVMWATEDEVISTCSGRNQLDFNTVGADSNCACA